MTESMKNALNNALASKSSENLKNAAKDAKQAKKVVPIFTPMQAIGKFAENLEAGEAKKFKGYCDNLLDDLTKEGTSRIAVGNDLIQIRTLLGDDYKQFEQEVCVKTLRKSVSTCSNYIGLASVFSLKFRRNPVVKFALMRIWGAEGCYDTTNGELKPEVDKAIKACGGIPKSGDSQVCEVWARNFVTEVDKQVKQSRGAHPGGTKTWDAETVIKKQKLILDRFKQFITHDGISSKMASGLLTEVLVIAVANLYASNVNLAFKNALAEVSKRKLKVKAVKEEIEQTRAEGSDVPLNQVSA